MFTHSFCYIVCATLCILKWDEYHDDDEIHNKLSMLQYLLISELQQICV